MLRAGNIRFVMEMKMEKRAIIKKIVQPAGVLLAACAALCLFGCSSNNRASAFQIVFAAASLNENAVAEFGTSITGGIPELTIEGRAPVFSSMMIGDTRNEMGMMTSDPMMAMGGIMRQAAMATTGELDVMIADMENGARNARSGMFMPLNEIFTAAELAALSERLLSFDILSTGGIEPAPTGERTADYGISITGNESMRRIFGNQEIGVFIIGNTKHPELAKKVVNSLL